MLWVLTCQFCVIQSTEAVEAPVAEPVMMDQDPPIDPSAETAPPGGEPRLPVSTRTGALTSTPQLGPLAPSPAATQEITPVSFSLALSMCNSHTH